MMYLLYIHFQDCYWLLSRWAVPYITHPFPMTHIKECLFHVLMHMGQIVKLSIGTDLKGQNVVASYVQHDDEFVGCIKLIKLWHAIGHTVHLVVILHDLSDAFFPQRLQNLLYQLISSSLDPSSQQPQLHLLKWKHYHYFLSPMSHRRYLRCVTPPQNIFCL